MSTKKMYVELFRAGSYTRDRKNMFNKIMDYLDNGAINYCFNTTDLTIAVEQSQYEYGVKLYYKASHDIVEEILSEVGDQ
jgi:hypothetical protein